MKVIWLASLLAIGASATPYSIATSHATLKTREDLPDFEIAHAGNYQINGCGAKYGPLLKRLLDYLHHDLVPVVKDAEESRTERSPYMKSFFMTSHNARFVAKVLTNVTTGVAMRPAEPPYTNGSPTFLCGAENQGDAVHVVLPNGTRVNPIELCHPDTGIGVSSYLSPTPYILVCPSFWQMPDLPSIAKYDCPVKNTTINRFIKTPYDYEFTGENMIKKQQWQLLELIVHYYLDFLTELRSEIYDLNDAVWGISGPASVGNAASYLYYAASIRLQCPDVHVSNAEAHGRRRTLEQEPITPAGITGKQNVMGVKIQGNVVEVTY